MPQVILNPGSPEEQTYTLRTGSTTIGRTQENDICVLHKSLSRRHARIDFEDGRITLIDLQSKNGTFVNGAKTARAELHPNDTFVCGEVPFLLTIEAAPRGDASDPTVVLDLETILAPSSMDALLDPTSQVRPSALKVKPSTREERAQDKLRVLLKVSQLLSSPGSIELLLERILQLIFQILEIDRAAILLIDPRTGDLRLRIAKTATGEPPTAPAYSQHIVDYVRKHKKAVLFSDTSHDSRLDTASSVMMQSIRSSMCVPLLLKEALNGVLYVDNRTSANRFSEEDLEFLAAFANQAGAALENVSLYKRIEEDAILRSSYLRFFPPTTVKRLQQSQGSDLGVIETDATVLFADISNFTAISSALRPRSLLELLNQYFPLVTEVIFRHEGTLEKYIGDAVMAVWGAPYPHPDDTDRAIRAAVDMHRVVADLNAELRTQGKAELHLHIGLNTGSVAAGNIGSERYLQYTTIGDAANVASRVCDIAKQDEIVITAPTFERWTQRVWPVTKLDPVTVKGKDEPLVLYRVDWAPQGDSP